MKFKCLYLLLFLWIIHFTPVFSASAPLIPRDSESLIPRDSESLIPRDDEPSTQFQWPHKVHKTIIRDFKKDELNQKYKRIISDELVEKTLSDQLYSAERSLRLSLSRKVPIGLIIGLLAQISNIGNDGYLPAIVKLSKFFLEGIYTLPRDKDFAIKLLGLINIDDDSVKIFDGDTVRFILKDLNLNKGIKQKQIAEKLGVDPSTVSRFFAGSNSPKILKRFKKLHKALFTDTASM